MPITVIQGEQRGDEGKGRFVDMLAPEFDIVARYNGGPNAGHTIVLPDGDVFKFHGLPSGFANENAVNVLGRGVLADATKLAHEIDKLEARGIEVSRKNLLIDSATRLILPHHVSADAIRERGTESQGTTQSGIAPAAADSSLRIGSLAESINKKPAELEKKIITELKKQRSQRKRAGLEELDEVTVAEEYVTNALRLGIFTTDASFYLRKALERGERILAEGAQGFLLDKDHGMIPYTSSSSTNAGGVAPGLGVPTTAIERIIGVMKVPQSHVGGGPFVTEIHAEGLLEQIHGDMDALDAERGTTTDRVRRLGYLDIPGLRRAVGVSGTHELALTKLDWVSRFGEQILTCVGYMRKGKFLREAPDTADKLESSTPLYEVHENWTEDIREVREFGDLPRQAQAYVEFVEAQVGVPISMIGVGPRRDQVIVRSK